MSTLSVARYILQLSVEHPLGVIVRTGRAMSKSGSERRLSVSSGLEKFAESIDGVI